MFLFWGIFVVFYSNVLLQFLNECLCWCILRAIWLAILADLPLFGGGQCWGNLAVFPPIFRAVLAGFPGAIWLFSPIWEAFLGAIWQAFPLVRWRNLGGLGGGIWAPRICCGPQKNNKITTKLFWPKSPKARFFFCCGFLGPIMLL